jgi:ATP-dependent Lon protease
MTGSLGEVMQESAQTALSFVRSLAVELEIPNDDFENYDIHVHVPEGAVPKEGPSAGITLAVALISAFTERKVRHDFGMTGEITLRGKILPIGGVREKIMAARRSQLKNVVLPAHNEKDMVDVPKGARRGLNLHFVDNMREVMDLVLLPPPPEGRQRDLNNPRAEDNEDDHQADNT